MTNKVKKVEIRMIAAIEENIDEIIALCKEHEVVRLEIFGSAVTDEFDPAQSDFDFLVEYPDGYGWGPFGSRHFELQERLEAILGRKVDLVILRNVENPYVIRSIQQSRQLLYAA